jgi:DNA-binding CsgD family transcriptional regulator
MASFSYEVAAREYGEALLLWREEDAAASGVDHVALLKRHARAAYLASDFRTATASCREAIEELDDADPARRTALLILLGRTQWVSGEWGPATDTYELALKTSPAEPPIVRVRALAGLGQTYMLHARLQQARPLLEAAIEGARAIGARDAEGHALNSLAAVVAGLGDVDDGRAWIDEARDIALELRIPDDIGRAYVNKVDIENWCGFPERALETTAEGMQLAAEWGVSASYGAFIGYGGVNAAFELGRWDDARDLVARADRAYGALATGEAYRAMYVAELLACSGDDRFEPMWERALRLTREAPPSDHAGLLYLGGIEQAAFAGDYALGARYAREGLGMLESIDSTIRLLGYVRVAAWPVAELGAAARRDGDEAALSDARDLLSSMHAIASARRSAMEPTGRLAELMALELSEAEVWQARLEGTDTAARWHDLAESWSALGRPFRAALARWHAGEAAVAVDDREEAATALRAAYEVATSLGAEPLRSQLEVLGRRLRVRLGGTRGPSAASQRAYGLTKRELEVLAEVAAGHTNREIAETLFISESTAGVHVSNILGKLGVATRTEAARVALDQGLLTA